MQRWGHRLAIRLVEDVRHRRGVFSRWRALERSQWQSPAELQARQTSGYRAMVAHAWETSAWHRTRWMAAGVTLEDALQAVTVLPTMTRADVREHLEALTSADPGSRILTKATGGSSGVPLTFRVDARSHGWRMAAIFRGYGWAGGGPGSRQWHLWGVPPGVDRTRAGRKRRLHDWLYHRHVESCFGLADDRLPALDASLRRVAPDVIVAYTSAVDELARGFERVGITPASPRGVIVGAERLFPHQRARIERVFRAPVFETYGSREFTLIGAECAHHTGLHVTVEHLIVEVVDAADRALPPGELGEIAVTDLTNRALPFIRYRTGDLGILADEPCPCGRGLPRLLEVRGRLLDILRGADGRPIAGELFPHLLKDFDVVEAFRVIQDDPTVITVEVVAPAWTERHDAQLRAATASALGPGTQLEIRAVPDLPRTGAGKRKLVENRLPGITP